MSSLPKTSWLRRCLVLAVLMSPLILVYGKILLTPLEVPGTDDENKQIRPYVIVEVFSPRIESRGWPWCFLKTFDSIQSRHVLSFSGLGVLADLLLFALVIAAAAAVLVRHRKRRGAWFRFSLRELLAVTTLVAAALGWWMYHQNHWTKEQQAIEYLVSKGCQVYTPFPYVGPEWLLRLLPDDWLKNFHRAAFLHTRRMQTSDDIRMLQSAVRWMPFVREIQFDDTRRDESLAKHFSELDRQFENSLTNADLSGALDHVEFLALCTQTANDEVITALGPMPVLKRLWIMDCPVSDRALESIGKWQALERFEIYFSRDFKNSIDGAPKITDAGIDHLAGLHHLQFLWLSGLPVADAGMKIISQMPTLETLAFQACESSTDASLAPLVNLPRLRELNVYGSNITDAGLEIISRLKQLESLNVGQCPNITDQGIRHVLTMPNLKTLEISPPTKISPAMLEELKQHIPKVSTE